MGRDCSFNGCPGCKWKCKCDFRCFKCQMGDRMSCMEASWTNWDFDAPRKKFLCFKCQKVWKSPWTKNMYDEMTSVQKTSIRNGGKPSCNTCGQHGLEVGSTFVHCKNTNEWKKLEEKVNNGTIDLVKEFTYCPMNNRVKWQDVYPINKRWNDTRQKAPKNIKPVIPRPTYEKQKAPLNAMGEAFLPGLF